MSDGIRVDGDSNFISGNIIIDCNQGIILNGDNNYGSGNSFLNVPFPIDDNGTGNAVNSMPIKAVFTKIV